LPLVSTPSLWIRTMLFAVFFGALTHIVVQKQVNDMNWLEALQTKE
jgi:hypothetical protein